MIQSIMLLALLGICSIEDIKYHRLTLNYIMIFSAVGIMLQIYSGEESFISIVGGVFLGLLVVLTSILTEGKIGLGDGTLLSATGIFLGFAKNLELFFLALVFSAIFSLVLLMKKKRKDYEMPFAPFLMAAYMGILCYGKLL